MRLPDVADWHFSAIARYLTCFRYAFKSGRAFCATVDHSSARHRNIQASSSGPKAPRFSNSPLEKFADFRP